MNEVGVNNGTLMSIGVDSEKSDDIINHSHKNIAINNYSNNNNNKKRIINFKDKIKEETGA